MHPTLIDLGTHDLPLLGETHLLLPTYGLLFASGVLVAWIWFMRRVRTLGIDPDAAFNLSFYSLIAGLLGAKLTLIGLDWRYYLSSLDNLLGTLRSAGVLMGGVLLAVLTFFYYSRRAGLPTLRLADAIVAPLALAQGIGRLGCFMAGCCYGVESGSWWAVTFTDPQAMKTGVPLVPIQLVQAANDVVLAVVLTLLWRRRVRPDGVVAWLFVLLYCLSRAILELWRGDAERGTYFGDVVSTSQLFSAAGFLAAVVALTILRRRGAEASA